MARPVPAELEDALAQSPAARERFWAMPSEQKDAWVAYVGRARLPGARRRRVAVAVHRLGGRTRLNGTGRNGVDAAPLPHDPSVWLLVVALLAGVAGLVVWLTMFRQHHTTRPTAVIVTARTTVPKVTGIRFQSAEFQLQQAKLAVRIAHRNAARPRGIVVAQRPGNGATVPQGTTVLLLVSKGPPRVVLPDLVGLAAADAAWALQKQKLLPTIEPSPAPQAPGTVLEEQPRAGARVKPGTNVVLQVAAPQSTQQVTTTQPTTTATPTSTARQTTTAARTTTRPTTTAARTTTRPTTTSAGAGLSPPASGNDYTGMRLAAAIQKLAAGRQQAIVAYVVSATQPAGVIVANRPSGSRERLAVSAGPQRKPQNSVPDVSGEDAPTARQDLQAAGFSAITVDWPVSDSVQDGLVVAEAPARGATVPAGVAIVLYVGSASGGG
jgi:beta-lactam-binding protein with PASTA domain